MSISDPSREEMVHFLRNQFEGSEIDDFDIEEAIYWFANDWHCGQWSNLYCVLSSSSFSPGMCQTEINRESTAGLMYEMLEFEFNMELKGLFPW